MEANNFIGWRVPWKAMLWGFAFAIVALIVVFVRLANPSEIMIELQEYPVLFFFLALFAVFLSWGVDGYRMRLLTCAAGVPVSWSALTFTLIAANFLTLITPFAAGGAPLVVYLLFRRGMSVAQATAVVIGGGFAAQLGLFTLATLVLHSMVEIPSDVSAFLGYVRVCFFIYGIALLALVVIVFQGKRIQLLFGKRKLAAEWIVDFQATFRALFARQGRYFLGALVTGFVYYAVYYSAGFFLLTGFDVSRSSVVLRYGVSVLLGIAPLVSPIPGGAGAAELVAYYVLEQTLPTDELATFIVLWRSAVFYLPIIIGGLVFTFLVLRWAHQRRNEA